MVDEQGYSAGSTIAQLQQCTAATTHGYVAEIPGGRACKTPAEQSEQHRIILRSVRSTVGLSFRVSQSLPRKRVSSNRQNPAVLIQCSSVRREHFRPKAHYSEMVEIKRDVIDFTVLPHFCTPLRPGQVSVVRLSRAGKRGEGFFPLPFPPPPVLFLLLFVCLACAAVLRSSCAPAVCHRLYAYRYVLERAHTHTQTHADTHQEGTDAKRRTRENGIEKESQSPSVRGTTRTHTLTYTTQGTGGAREKSFRYYVPYHRRIRGPYTRAKPPSAATRKVEAQRDQGKGKGRNTYTHTHAFGNKYAHRAVSSRFQSVCAVLHFELLPSPAFSSIHPFSNVVRWVCSW